MCRKTSANNMCFPLNNTIIIPYKNVVYCTSLDICSNCNKNSTVSVLPVSGNKAYSGNQYSGGEKESKKRKQKRSKIKKINICCDKHSLENGFLGLLLLKLQH